MMPNLQGLRARRGVARMLRPVRQKMMSAVDRFVLLAKPGRKERRVLLVRLDNIGDFVLWLDAARVLTAFYQERGYAVTLLASDAWAQFAAELGVFDEVIALERERFKTEPRYRLRMLRGLRGRGFAKAIEPTMTPVMCIGEAVLRVSGAEERVGVTRDARALAGALKHGSLTRGIDVDVAVTGELAANAEFVRQLTGLPYRAKVAVVAVTREMLPAGWDEPRGKYAVLFPGASEAGKRWPEQRFVEIARRLREECRSAVVVCGGPGDVDMAERIANTCGEGVTSLAGRTSLMELAAVLAGARVLVSNDTAAVHLAAAVGTASVCVVGGGHPGRFLPYRPEMMDARPLPRVAQEPMACFGCEWKCKFHPAKGDPMPCVDAVSVAAVWKLISAQMESRVEEMEACV